MKALDDILVAYPCATSIGVLRALLVQIQTKLAGVENLQERILETRATVPSSESTPARPNNRLAAAEALIALLWEWYCAGCGVSSDIEKAAEEYQKARDADTGQSGDQKARLATGGVAADIGSTGGAAGVLKTPASGTEDDSRPTKHVEE